MSAHPSCCHRGHCIPLWVGLFQHLSTRVSHPLLVAGHCAVSLCNACSTDLIHPNVCVVERRFVSLTLSCVPFVTRDAKCGSFLTLAITLRYLPGRDGWWDVVGLEFHFGFWNILCLIEMASLPVGKPSIWQWGDSCVCYVHGNMGWVTWCGCVQEVMCNASSPSHANPGNTFLVFQPLCSWSFGKDTGLPMSVNGRCLIGPRRRYIVVIGWLSLVVGLHI